MHHVAEKLFAFTLELTQFGDVVHDDDDAAGVRSRPRGAGSGGQSAAATETIAFGGALISQPGREKVERLDYSYSTKLRDLLNKPETLQSNTGGETLSLGGWTVYDEADE